jgi:hypothetical protein
MTHPLSLLHATRETLLVILAGLFWLLVMGSMVLLLGLVALLVALTVAVFWCHDRWRRLLRPAAGTGPR